MAQRLEVIRNGMAGARTVDEILERDGGNTLGDHVSSSRTVACPLPVSMGHNLPVSAGRTIDRRHPRAQEDRFGTF